MFLFNIDTASTNTIIIIINNYGSSSGRNREDTPHKAILPNTHSHSLHRDTTHSILEAAATMQRRKKASLAGRGQI